MSSLFSRRHFIGGALTAVGALNLPATRLSAGAANPSSAGSLPEDRANPFIYRFNVGDFEAWSISDGHLLFKEGLQLMWPPDKRELMANELRAHAERTDGFPLYINVLVLRRGSEIVLFDSGFGAHNNPSIGWLAAGLAAIDIAPQQVTQAILSHGHADHIGGFVSEGRAVYPNAALRVMKAEADFWFSPQPDFSKSHRRDNIPKMIRDVRSALEVLKPHLQLHRDGDQILDGAITFEAAPGHTAGHCILRIKDGADSLVHFMDVSHHHRLMLTEPSWFIEFDHLPEVAVATRKKVFQRLAATRERAFGFHHPWPGIGRVLPQPGGYRWEAERWSWGS